MPLAVQEPIAVSNIKSLFEGAQEAINTNLSGNMILHSDIENEVNTISN